MELDRAITRPYLTIRSQSTMQCSKCMRFCFATNVCIHVFGFLCDGCKCKTMTCCCPSFNQGGYCLWCSTKCQSCGAKTSPNKPLCRSCFRKIPVCFCGAQVETNTIDGDLYSFCKLCRCRNFNCNNPSISRFGYCQLCSQQKKCKSCRQHKFHSENVKCSKCTRLQAYNFCTSGRSCQQLVGFNSDGLPFAFCAKCACRNKKCSNIKTMSSKYCEKCQIILTEFEQQK
jgi:hypothetical protein